MQNFKKPLTSLFYKSPRSNDTRLGEIIAFLPVNLLKKITPSFIIIGHPDDEGIRLNHGRAGSSKAPKSIRSAFYRLYPGTDKFPQTYDIGDFTSVGSLIKRQEKALHATSKIFNMGHRLLALGGGHDHAYSDIGGFLEIFGKYRPLVFNIDAHLDVRPVIKGPNSGTPFYQLLEKYPGVELVEIGIQSAANSLANLSYARKKKVRVFNYKQTNNKILSLIKKMPYANRPVFLSIDIDAFSSAFAPGASAASPVGLNPHELLNAMPWLTSHLNIRGLGIYEVSPPLDRDNQTSKLAAKLMHSFLFGIKNDI
ncbi:MAG: hypothetical protein A2Z20_06600 [Bdellovibrionales bacterium RBG_16_40_8]|nr:MAG: hypothetical protein A2Z20_06600 [Bdellovibrionales bacterium RBG_16_40_8]